MSNAIYLQRVYDAKPPFPRPTFLVDRLWPRGISKAQLEQVVWLKDVAPSEALRKAFHDDQRWEDFVKHYRVELAESDAWQPLLNAFRQQDITLLFGSKDTRHNQAVVLHDFLSELIAPE